MDGSDEGSSDTASDDERSATPDDERNVTSSDERSATQVRCTSCGAEIDTTDWYPVRKERDSDGTLYIHPFCSERCRDEWQDETTD